MRRNDALDWAVQEKVIESARRLVLRLAGAVNSLKTYPVDHPSLQFSHRGIAGALTEIYELVGTSVLELHEDAVLIGDLRADIDPVQHPHMRDLTAWMKRHDALTLRVDGTVTPEQVQRFLAVASETEALTPPQAREHVNRVLAEESIGQIQIGANRVRARAEQRERDIEVQLLEGYLELCALTEEMLTNGARTGTLSAIARTTEALADALAPRVQVVPALLGAGAALAYESRHVANMTVLSVGVAARLGLPLPALQDLARAVATMDAGMTVLPAEVRRAGRELLPQERATLRTHPIESVRVHLRERSLDEGARRRLVVAMEQHLGLRRDGYPAVHLWPPLHLYSRIAATCDAYDALTSTTAWRRGMPPSQALAQLVPPHDHVHDPAIVAELCALVGEFPEACRVRLSTGRIAAVLQARGPSGLPLVRLEDGASAGQRVDLGDRAADGKLVQTISEILLVEGRPGLG